MSRDRGFASMDQANRREIARKGGRAAHLRGKAHEWTRDEARTAGRKGGGVLLRSGDVTLASRVISVAAALDDVATTLDQISNDRVASKPDLINSMRQSISRASAALDRIEKRHNP